ncbi:hypothetical protein AGMMS49579_15260 [Spirochaetia bacterium]|nr:hypothetical protein AGMMS49579_15260 [Spirochaetia bacterium]
MEILLHFSVIIMLGLIYFYLYKNMSKTENKKNKNKKPKPQPPKPQPPKPQPLPKSQPNDKTNISQLAMSYGCQCSKT